jgi:23S rRNA (guanosine2251-2'-O)-methyltransferase
MNIYGKNVVKDSILKGKKIEKVYITNQFKDIELLSLIEKKQLKLEKISKDQMNRMVSGNHQGIVARIPDYDYVPLENLVKENAFLVILDHLEDPHNFGAIIRTCEAAGVDGIIIPRDRSVSVNPTVIKVSTGAIAHMKIARVTNIAQTIEELKKNGFWIVGTDMQGTDYTQIDYTGSIALVIGNEGSGMSQLVKKSCDFIASISMQGKTNSLNASVATGIVVFEAVNCRRNRGL